MTLRLGLEGTDLAWPREPGDTVPRSALRAGIGPPCSCDAGACGRAELPSGELRHPRADPPALTDEDRARNRWLGCQAHPLSDGALEARPDPAAALPPRPLRRRGTLLSAAPRSHDMAEFAFRATGDALLAEHEVYLAGPPLRSQAIQLALHAAGVPRAQLHFDEFT